MELKAYANTLGNAKMCMPSGKEVIFLKGRCVTKDPRIIAYLDEELASGNPFLRVAPVQETETPTDSIAGLRAKIIAEEIAAGRLALTASKDRGTYESDKLNAANSRDVAVLAGGSISVDAGPITATVPVQSAAQLDMAHGKVIDVAKAVAALPVSVRK